MENKPESRPDLLKKLIEYGKTNFYPFHMPGHKRQTQKAFAENFSNPFSIDITEIDGFDNLHHPEAILKESMEWASGLYGSDKTYYLINGSSCGILSAICGTTSFGGTLLMSRNCHKSAYHGVILNHLKTEYIYPQTIKGFGLQGGLNPEDFERMLIKHPEIEAVLVVSPTYDGIVSDIGAISSIVHSHGIPLIVDEAHGAHFPFGQRAGFPKSALDLGADVVIQSLHKTLPSFTQTAILHVKRGYVNTERIERYLSMFQSSSPSYVLLAGIENCLGFMQKEGMEELEHFSAMLTDARERLRELKNLKLLTEDVCGKDSVFAIDRAKIVISCRESSISGAALFQRLREEYHLELEMCGPDYVTAITSLADTREGIERLVRAFIEIDQSLDTDKGQAFIESHEAFTSTYKLPIQVMTLADAAEQEGCRVPIKESEEFISAEFVYLYPPGIPIVAPGELLTPSLIDTILEYKRMGLLVQGMEDEKAEEIRVLKGEA